MSIVIAAATAAATYDFEIPQGQTWQFTGYGFSGSDAISLQVLTSDGTYADYKESATAITLSADNNSRHVQGPFIGRWSKGTTTGSVGMRRYRNPL